MNRCVICEEHRYMELYRCDVCKTDYKSYVCDDCYKYRLSTSKIIIPLLKVCKSCRREEKLNKIGI